MEKEEKKIKLKIKMNIEKNRKILRIKNQNSLQT